MTPDQRVKSAGPRQGRQRHERKRVHKAPKRNNSKPDDDIEVTVEGPGKSEPEAAPCAS